MPRTLRLAALLLPLLSTSGLATAADIGSAPEIQLEAAAARFYLRGDIAYELRSDLGLTGTFATAAEPVAAGLGAGEIDEGIAGGLGIGVQATDWLRADATVRFFEHDVDLSAPVICLSASLCGTSGGPSDVRAVELMGNVYADLGTVAGFTPYVGGGLGAVHLSYGDGVFPVGGPVADSLTVRGQESWRFAYALGAGVAYDVTPSVALDLGYRYLDVEGGEATSFAAPTPGLAGFDAVGRDDGFDRHSIQIGLRYRFG